MNKQKKYGKFISYWQCNFIHNKYFKFLKKTFFRIFCAFFHSVTLGRYYPIQDSNFSKLTQTYFEVVTLYGYQIMWLVWDKINDKTTFLLQVLSHFITFYSLAFTPLTLETWCDWPETLSIVSSYVKFKKLLRKM